MSLRRVRNGFFVARGTFGLEAQCTLGEVTGWSVEVDTDAGIAFGAGPAVLRTFFEFGTDGFRDFVEGDDVPDEPLTLS